MYHFFWLNKIELGILYNKNVFFRFKNCLPTTETSIMIQYVFNTGSSVQDYPQICKDDLWPQRSLNAQKKLLKDWSLWDISIYVVIENEIVSFKASK